jgi:very-short-patch-repair endonuclease
MEGVAQATGRASEVLVASSSRFVLAHRAAGMRSAPTTTEALLWTRLSGGQLGVGFRRQFVIGRFIADFAAPAARLIVEVDGGYHQQRARADARRDRELTRLGWRVLRVPAELVLHRLGDAVALVRAALSSG